MIQGVNSGVAAAQVYKDQVQKEALDSRNTDTRVSEQRSNDIQEVTQQNRIAQLKDSIANKEYEIDLQKTSEKMALDLLNL